MQHLCKCLTFSTHVSSMRQLGLPQGHNRESHSKLKANNNAIGMHSIQKDPRLTLAPVIQLGFICTNEHTRFLKLELTSTGLDGSTIRLIHGGLLSLNECHFFRGSTGDLLHNLWSEFNTPTLQSVAGKIELLDKFNAVGKI